MFTKFLSSSTSARSSSLSSSASPLSSKSKPKSEKIPSSSSSLIPEEQQHQRSHSSINNDDAIPELILPILSSSSSSSMIPTKNKNKIITGNSDDKDVPGIVVEHQKQQQQQYKNINQDHNSSDDDNNNDNNNTDKVTGSGNSDGSVGRHNRNVSIETTSSHQSIDLYSLINSHNLDHQQQQQEQEQEKTPVDNDNDSNGNDSPDSGLSFAPSQLDYDDNEDDLMEEIAIAMGSHNYNSSDSSSNGSSRKRCKDDSNDSYVNSQKIGENNKDATLPPVTTIMSSSHNLHAMVNVGEQLFRESLLADTDKCNDHENGNEKDEDADNQKTNRNVAVIDTDVTSSSSSNTMKIMTITTTDNNMKSSSSSSSLYKGKRVLIRRMIMTLIALCISFIYGIGGFGLLVTRLKLNDTSSTVNNINIDPASRNSEDVDKLPKVLTYDFATATADNDNDNCQASTTTTTDTDTDAVEKENNPNLQDNSKNIIVSEAVTTNVSAAVTTNGTDTDTVAKKKNPNLQDTNKDIIVSKGKVEELCDDSYDPFANDDDFNNDYHHVTGCSLVDNCTVSMDCSGIIRDNCIRKLELMDRMNMNTTSSKTNIDYTWSIVVLILVGSSALLRGLGSVWSPSSSSSLSPVCPTTKKNKCSNDANSNEPTTPTKGVSATHCGLAKSFLTPPSSFKNSSVEPMGYMSPCYGDDALDISHYESMKSEELRSLLRDRKGDTTGTKSKLIRKLVTMYQAEFACLTVQQLRPKLRRRNLNQGGNKEDIIRRLVEAGPI